MNESMQNFDCLAISIVSHGHGYLIYDLIMDLMPIIKKGAKVLVTINIPENECFLQKFEELICVIRNSKPLGYGENHNNACRLVNREWFVVLNPDIRVNHEIFGKLILSHKNICAGISAPKILSPNGCVEDSVRFYPTFKLVLIRSLKRIFNIKIKLDYELEGNQHVCVDWMAGMFLLFKSQDFCLMGGFDQKYFMYLEDADICRRFNNDGFPVVIFPTLHAVHDARRASGRNIRHFI